MIYHLISRGRRVTSLIFKPKCLFGLHNTFPSADFEGPIHARYLLQNKAWILLTPVSEKSCVIKTKLILESMHWSAIQLFIGPVSIVSSTSFNRLCALAKILLSTMSSFQTYLILLPRYLTIGYSSKPMKTRECSLRRTSGSKGPQPEVLLPKGLFQRPILFFRNFFKVNVLQLTGLSLLF